MLSLENQWLKKKKEMKNVQHLYNLITEPTSIKEIYFFLNPLNKNPSPPISQEHICCVK